MLDTALAYVSLCLSSGVLTCFSADYAYAYVAYACAYAVVKNSLKKLTKQKSKWEIIALFKHIQSQLKSTATTKYDFATVNNLSGPLGKQQFALTGSKGQACQLWLVDFDPFLFVPFFKIRCRGCRHIYGSMAAKKKTTTNLLTVDLSRGCVFMKSAINKIIIWVAPWAGKMNQIPCCDWLPERERWNDLARSGLRALSRKENFPLFWCLNPYNKSFID